MPSTEKPVSAPGNSAKQPGKQAPTNIKSVDAATAAYQGQSESMYERATLAPDTLTTRDIMQLQRTMGNRAVSQLLAKQSQPKVPNKLMAKEAPQTPDSELLEAGAEPVAPASVHGERVQLKSLSFSMHSIQRMPAKDLKVLFSFEGITNRGGFRAKIGKGAFDKFKGADEAQVKPLVDFFKRQVTERDAEIPHAEAQSDFLFPLVADKPKLELAKEVLVESKYDPAVAKPKYDYLGRHLDQVDLAKKILLENANDPVEAEKALQKIIGKMKESSGTNAFEKNWKTLTDKTIGQSLTSNEAKPFRHGTEKSGKVSELFPDMAAIKSTDNDGKVRDKINEAKGEKVEKLKAEEIKIRKAIEPLLTYDAVEDAIGWCLDQAKIDQGKLATLVKFVIASIKKGISFAKIKPLVAGKESKLFDLIEAVGEDSIPKLPELISIATLPVVDKLLYQADEVNIDTVTDWLITKKMSIQDINALLAKNLTGDTFVLLLSWLKDITRPLKVSTLAPDVATLEKFISEIKADVPAKLAVANALSAEATDWKALLALDAVKKVRGLKPELITVDRPEIQEVSVDSLPDPEKGHVKATLKYIKSGDVKDKPVLTHPAGAKWGELHENNQGRLPGARGAGGYKEWYVEKAAGAGDYHGERRLVKSDSTGFIYYTANHYTTFSRID